jgi:hypothetical protein
MHIALRIALAVVILIIDFVSFMVPLGSLAIAWVIVARPRWALDFIDKLYADDGPQPPPPTATPPAPPTDSESAGP